MIQSKPYDIEHVELRHLSLIGESSIYVALVDAVLWCCQPRSLTLELELCTYTSHIAKVRFIMCLRWRNFNTSNTLVYVLFHFHCKNQVLCLIFSFQYTCQKLIQQEYEGQTYIKFLLSTFSEDEQYSQYFSDLSSLLKALHLLRTRCEITFIKEEGTLFILVLFVI